jgi:formate/nitrite transporter FocA (FNT family)
LPAELNFLDQNTFEILAQNLIKYSWYIIAISGILAGWLMGLLSWLITSSQETISRIVIIILITSVIGIGGLHHAIVGSIEIFTAFLTSESVTLSNYLYVQAWATIGNLIGGVVFVALIKFSHVNPRRKYLADKDK